VASLENELTYFISTATLDLCVYVHVYMYTVWKKMKLHNNMIYNQQGQDKESTLRESSILGIYA